MSKATKEDLVGLELNGIVGIGICDPCHVVYGMINFCSRMSHWKTVCFWLATRRIGERERERATRAGILWPTTMDRRSLKSRIVA